VEPTSSSVTVQAQNLTAASARAARMGTDPLGEPLVARLLEVSRRGLPLMFDGQTSMFAYTRKSEDAGRSVQLQGKSDRYGAIVLLGANLLPHEQQAEIFNGRDADNYCSAMLSSVDGMTNVGDVALLVWAAAEIGSSRLEGGLTRLRYLMGEASELPTVEAAWCVSALVAAHARIPVAGDIAAARDRLLLAYNKQGGIFGHSTNLEGGGLRGHVACFADQVYPIQALARLNRYQADQEALDAANSSARAICREQGPGGQWWWHYDHRTGRVLEGYPVYTVHQDSMGPMALFDLAECGGEDFTAEIRKGLEWMDTTTELSNCLIDDELQLIWRKIGRTDPKKALRGARAALSRVHPGLRAGWPDRVFPANRIDWESRPYHLGWVLYAWLCDLTGGSAK